METDSSNGESDEVQSDRQRGAGEEEDDNNKDSTFSLVFDPVPTREAAPVRRTV